MEDAIIYVIVGISILGNIFQWIFIENLLSQNGQLEKIVLKALKANDKINEDVEKYYKVLQGIYTKAYTELTKIDKNGSFSSDDEVGWSFGLILDTIKDITEKLNNFKREDTDEEKD